MKIILKEDWTDSKGVIFPKGTELFECDNILNSINGKTHCSDVVEVITREDADGGVVTRKMGYERILPADLVKKIEVVLELPA